MMATEPKPYLEYLDKEMTIMGILSAFSVAIASFATERIVTAQSGFLKDVWQVGRDHVITGAATALLAALFFYLQRSLLAWYYGQIALAQSRGAASPDSVDEWLSRADGWDTWVRYQTGFIVLTLSFACYGYAIATALYPVFGRIPGRWSILLPLLVVFLTITLRWRVLTRFAQEEQPFRAAWTSLQSGRPTRSTPTHRTKT